MTKVDNSDTHRSVNEKSELKELADADVDKLINKVAITSFSNAFVEENLISMDARTPRSLSPVKNDKEQTDLVNRKTVQEFNAIISSSLENQPNARIKSIEKVPLRVVSRIRFTRGVQTATFTGGSEVFYPPKWMKALVLTFALLLGLTIRVCVIDYTTNPFHRHQSWTEYYDGGRVWRLDVWSAAARVASNLAVNEASAGGKLALIELRYWQQEAAKRLALVPQPPMVFPPPKDTKTLLLPANSEFYDFDGTLKQSPTVYMISLAKRRMLNHYYLYWRSALDAAAYRWGFLDDLGFASREHERITYLKQNLNQLFPRENAHLRSKSSSEVCDSQATVPQDFEPWAETGQNDDAESFQHLVSHLNSIINEKLQPIKQVPKKAKLLLDNCVEFIQHDVWDWISFMKHWLNEQLYNSET